jgi:signal transduction histidine kinase
LVLARKIEYKDEVKQLLNRISAVYFEKKEFSRSLSYADSSLKHSPALNSYEFRSNTYNIIGANYKDLDMMDSALLYLHKSLYLGLAAKDWIYVPGSLVNIAALHLENFNYDSCIYYSRESLKISYRTKILAYQETALLQLYNAFKGKGLYDSALKYHEDYTGVRWQIFNVKRSEMIEEIQTRYNIEKNKQENERQQVENELLRNKLVKQRLIIFVIIIAIIIALYIPFSLNRKRKHLASTNEVLTNQFKEIEKQKSELSELNKTKDKILSIIAHDMMNPFQSILGFSKLLLEESKKSEENDIRQYAEYIEKGTKNLNVLLGNLLKWSQLQVGKLKIEKESIDVLKVVNDIENLFTTAIQEKRIIFSREIAPKCKAYCDHHSLSTVLRNLVSNAIKFTRFDGEIKVQCLDNHLDKLEIVISDNGVGMDAENLSKLFSLDKPTSIGTNYEKGSGFGLILSKEFVLKNGGEIWAESEINKGTNIHFTVPKEQ